MSARTPVCLGCGHIDPQFARRIKEKLTGKYYFECEKCFTPHVGSSPDVYFKAPGYDMAIHDHTDPTYDPDKGTFVRSKQHKKYLLDKLGATEAGDPVHGARNLLPRRMYNYV